MKKYYNYPTQVAFIEKYQVEEYGAQFEVESGIAYGDMVICSCCGSTIPLEEILWVKEFKWIDLNEAIRGDYDIGSTDFLDEHDTEEYSTIVEKYIKEFEQEGEDIEITRWDCYPLPEDT